MTDDILLVNTNVVRPPVSPVGLEYVGEALLEAGVSVRAIDFSFESDPMAALRRELAQGEPIAVGLTVRNTDDCSFHTRKYFLPWICEVVAEVRRQTRACVVLGGVGFSVMPEHVLRITGADFGVAGDGEDAMLSLIHSLEKKEDVTRIPNLVYWRDGNIVCNPRVYVDLSRLPLPRRHIFNNRRYEEEGAIVGVETKRGCSRKCIFCADPIAKGSRSRLRPPGMVVMEFQDLLDQGVSWFHLCDAEFNQPAGHAKEVCRAIIGAGLGDKLRWYTYCSPSPFDRELADLMKKAGCCGINFGVDSLCDEQLRRLGRSYRKADVKRLVHILKEQGLRFMFDLLVGGPGETEETVATTIRGVKELDVPLAGIADGVRVYPGTSLSKELAGNPEMSGLHKVEGNLSGEPLFYLSPSLGNNASVLMNRLTAGDPRFVFLSSPEEQGSYNYAGAEALCRMIKEGARGAYWDILSRSR